MTAKQIRTEARLAKAARKTAKRQSLSEAKAALRKEIALAKIELARLRAKPPRPDPVFEAAAAAWAGKRLIADSPVVRGFLSTFRPDPPDSDNATPVILTSAKQPLVSTP